MRRCIVTLKLGESYNKLAGLTTPSMIRYARRCKADFHVIQTREVTKMDASWRHNTWEKMQVRHLLAIFDQVLFLDLDVYVGCKCPDIFKRYTRYPFCGNMNTLAVGAEQVERYAPFVPEVVLGNSGVILVKKEAKEVFERPDDWQEQAAVLPYAEQLWLFSRARELGFGPQPIPDQFNERKKRNVRMSINHATGGDKVAQIEDYRCRDNG